MKLDLILWKLKAVKINKFDMDFSWLFKFGSNFLVPEYIPFANNVSFFCKLNNLDLSQFEQRKSDQ